MKHFRSIAAVMAAAVSLTAFTACGSSTNYDRLLKKDDPVVITIWHYYNGIQQSQFDEMISEFNNTVGAEKGIIAEAFSKNSVNELSTSILASVNNDVGADPVPDIFGTYAETAYIIDKKGMLADLSQYFTDDELSGYVDEYIAEGRLDQPDALKIFPIAKSTELMMVNATDWNKFAASENVTADDLSTWEGLVTTSEKYYNYTDALTPDIPDDGKAFFGRDSIANYIVIGAMQLGHPIAADDGSGNITVTADKETFRKLWDNYYVPYVKGYFTAKSRFRSDDMKTGSIISMVCSSSAASYCPSEVTIDDDYTYPIDIQVLPVPNFEGCDPYIVQQGAGMSVIKSDPKTEYACSVFLKWFTEEDRNIEFSVNSGYLPVKKDANDIEKISSAKSDIDATMKDTIALSIDEINSYSLYTSPPFESSAEVRKYVEDYLTDTSAAAYEEAWGRIADGTDRDIVLVQYTNDAAFENWYADLVSGLESITGK